MHLQWCFFEIHPALSKILYLLSIPHLSMELDHKPMTHKKFGIHFTLWEVMM